MGGEDTILCACLTDSLPWEWEFELSSFVLIFQYSTTLCSLASAEKCNRLILFWRCLFQQKKTYPSQNSHLALGGTPAALALTRLRQTRARDGCVFSRCSSESEVRISTSLLYLLKETSQKESHMMTLLCRGYTTKCGALLKIKYRWRYFKFPFSGERLLQVLYHMIVYPIQTKTWRFACGASLHNNYDKDGMQPSSTTLIVYYNVSHTKDCTTCTTRYNVRTRMKMQRHVTGKVDVQIVEKKHFYTRGLRPSERGCDRDVYFHTSCWANWACN